MSSDALAPPDLALSRRLGNALFVGLCAAIAALLAHVCTDIAGDYLLPHDPYDDIAHGSRTLVTCGLLAVAVRVAWHLLFAAIERTRDERGFARRVGRSRLVGYGAAIVGATFVLLVTMECFDLRAAGQRIDDLSDLLGGSWILGAGLTLPIALGVGLIAWTATRWLGIAETIVARLVNAWFVARERHADESLAHPSDHLPRFTRQPAFARNSTKRGPPLLRG